MLLFESAVAIMLAELHSVFGVVLLVTVLLVYRSSSSSQSSLPVVNNRKAFEFRYVHARKRFLCNASDLLKAGFEKVQASYPEIGEVHGRAIDIYKSYAGQGIPSNDRGRL
jgi:hypothetical protein